MPKGLYRGEKATKLVRMKIAAKASKTEENRLEMMFAKYNEIIAAPERMSMALSTVPIFGFIIRLVYKPKLSAAIYFNSYFGYTSRILFRPNRTNPSPSIFFSKRETTTRTVPNSLANCSCVI